MRALRAAGAAGIAAVLVLGGCGTEPDLAPGVAEELQASVLALHHAAAEGRYDAAAAAADRVRDSLVAAAEAGEVSVARYRQIDEALERVEVTLGEVAAHGGDGHEGLVGEADDAQSVDDARPAEGGVEPDAEGTSTSSAGTTQGSGPSSDGSGPSSDGSRGAPGGAGTSGSDGPPGGGRGPTGAPGKGGAGPPDGVPGQGRGRG